MLTDEDVDDLACVVYNSVSRPAFYKDTFGLDIAGRKAAAVLRRHGVDVTQDGDTGKVTVERATKT